MEFRKNGRYALLVTLCLFGCSLAWQREYYTAAVYDHARLGDDQTDDAATVLKANLDSYGRAAGIAKEQGADLIVFPEYGLFPPVNRSRIKRYLESVPNPRDVTVTPCDQEDVYEPILYALSCMAKLNGIVVVANMGGIEKCQGEHDCPSDGDRHLNTNVAFDSDGTLIARYYKERLFFEFGMDLPTETQDPVFDTEFGRFAMFICFDIIFGKMTSVSREVDAVLFSTMWMNTSPFYISTQAFQAWAVGNNATILASNIQIPAYLAAGSGIYTGEKGAIAQTLNPDGIPKLVVARVPRGHGDVSPMSRVTAVLQNGTEEWNEEEDGKDVPEVCSYSILGPAENIFKDYRCWQENVENYTLVKLEKARDTLEACHNGMCCRLDYVADAMNETFYLGVYNGTLGVFSSRYFWWEENCFLARCDALNGTECATFPMMSHTVFHEISMTAHFSTDHIFPSFVGNRARVLPVEDWTFTREPQASSIRLTSDSGIPLIAATLKGRVYRRDPPYVR